MEPLIGREKELLDRVAAEGVTLVTVEQMYNDAVDWRPF